jgi:hypothetical protein
VHPFNTFLHHPTLNTSPAVARLPRSADDGWTRLDLTWPLLHPETAHTAEQHHGLPHGSLMAVACGEAWWQDSTPHLPPGRRWDDGRDDPLWQWPPPLRWPPPRPGEAGWDDQALTFSLSTDWKDAVGQQTCGVGLAAVAHDLPDVLLLQAIPLPPWIRRRHVTLALRRMDAVAARLDELQAPVQIRCEGYRALQQGLLDFLQAARARCVA